VQWSRPPGLSAIASTALRRSWCHPRSARLRRSAHPTPGRPQSPRGPRRLSTTAWPGSPGSRRRHRCACSSPATRNPARSGNGSTATPRRRTRLRRSGRPPVRTRRRSRGSRATPLGIAGQMRREHNAVAYCQRTDPQWREQVAIPARGAHLPLLAVLMGRVPLRTGSAGEGGSQRRGDIAVGTDAQQPAPPEPRQFTGEFEVLLT
ncbi:MAG: hypothetical protein JWL97_3658, partial [Gemmatimonadales bacterium]|nr:hypothetical protein [Gemmatimonadales bacterium]